MNLTKINKTLMKAFSEICAASDALDALIEKRKFEDSYEEAEIIELSNFCIDFWEKH